MQAHEKKASELEINGKSGVVHWSLAASTLEVVLGDQKALGGVQTVR